MSIKCAHCKGMHESVAEVRKCSSADPTREHFDTHGVGTLDRTESATEKQVAFITRLMSQKDVPTASPWPTVAVLMERADDALGGKTITKKEASKVIEWLLALDDKEPPKDGANWPDTPSHDDVPAGRYALGSKETNVNFFQVDRPGRDSKWSGRVFVKRLVGAPGDFATYPVRGSQAQQVLNEIAKDPRAAALLYGQEVGECGVCHSPLTNEASRAAGIGPVCAQKRNW